MRQVCTLTLRNNEFARNDRYIDLSERISTLFKAVFSSEHQILHNDMSNLTPEALPLTYSFDLLWRLIKYLMIYDIIRLIKYQSFKTVPCNCHLAKVNMHEESHTLRQPQLQCILMPTIFQKHPSLPVFQDAPNHSKPTTYQTIPSPLHGERISRIHLHTILSNLLTFHESIF